MLGIAYLTSRAGLSTALGAFIAGIVISESEYSHQVLADVLPFRETFNSLFFVSIGMLLNPAFLIAHAGTVLLLSAAVLIGKTCITAGIVALLGMPFRIATMVGLYLGQIGEFSLVLLTAAGMTGTLPGRFRPDDPFCDSRHHGCGDIHGVDRGSSRRHDRVSFAPYQPMSARFRITRSSLAMV